MGSRGDRGADRGKWMALAAALLGWMFDGLEQGLFPLVGRPALQELLGPTDESVIAGWISIGLAAFLVGMATGGVLFGWLGDRIGRVRAMTLSVLAYAVFSGLCGLAQAPWHIAVLRFLSALGMGGEWSLGVALVMEIWPDRSRGMLAGLIGAAANVGYLLIAIVGRGLTTFLQQTHDSFLGAGLSPRLVDFLLGNAAWRLLFFIGATPALFTFLIRLFVPESERWQRERERGSTSLWATQDLLGVLVGAAGAGAIIYGWAENIDWVYRLPLTAVGLVIATVGYLYPVLRFLQRSGADVTDPYHGLRPTIRRMLLASCLSGVALLATWGATQWIPTWADQLTEGQNPGAKADTQIASAIGAILGTIVGALIGQRFGRRLTYSLFCFASLVATLFLYQFQTNFGIGFLLSVFLVGCTTASFYGWLPLYLPELFRTRVRATGQGFSYNFGRILAAMGVLQTGNLLRTQTVFRDNYPQALSVVSLIYLVGMAIIWLAPETRGKPLPE